MRLAAGPSANANSFVLRRRSSRQRNTVVKAARANTLVAILDSLRHLMALPKVPTASSFATRRFLA